jgi:hypothetical protein
LLLGVIKSHGGILQVCVMEEQVMIQIMT